MLLSSKTDESRHFLQSREMKTHHFFTISRQMEPLHFGSTRDPENPAPIVVYVTPKRRYCCCSRCTCLAIGIPLGILIFLVYAVVGLLASNLALGGFIFCGLGECGQYGGPPTAPPIIEPFAINVVANNLTVFEDIIATFPDPLGNAPQFTFTGGGLPVEVSSTLLNATQAEFTVPSLPPGVYHLSSSTNDSLYIIVVVIDSSPSSEDIASFNESLNTF